MINVRFETNPFLKRVAIANTYIRYVLLRPFVSWLAYHLYYKYRSKTKFKTNEGTALKKGIAFCLVARDEGYTIEACLKSIVGFADQLIAVDNGSTDDTFLKMTEFNEQYGNSIDIVLLKRPDLNLSECRQLCLNYVNRIWFFRGDGDFILLSKFKELKKIILKYTRPGAVSLKLIELFGDEHHCNRYVQFIRPGEYYLRSFERDIQYEEFFGRIEHARIPIYYRLQKKDAVGLIHANFCKSNKRIFYRTCYLDYREYANHHDEPMDFEAYEKKWIAHVFKSENPELIEYRMARLIAVMCKKMSLEYEEEIERTGIEIFQSPYIVMYREDHPFIRVRRNEVSKFTNEYVSRFENLQWVPDADEFYSDSLRIAFLEKI
ncbi:MAG: hypothetical protein IPO83_08845 [Chitinophagaceae bacterium]|nr:hypothetical protein [Chitinophagaceae bacterium]